ncbi:hypothetical protein [Veillonella sp.]|uniref:hypothetical protein n=1 Tax=Veillonella sp. TaxID=1926307 RepID=UPI0025E3E34F|nr:hypothetical protein [Veillonella sp.]
MYVVMLNNQIIAKSSQLNDLIDDVLEQEVPCLTYLYNELIDEWLLDNPLDKAILKRIKTQLIKKNAKFAIYGNDTWYHIIPEIWTLKDVRQCLKKVNPKLCIKKC